MKRVAPSARGVPLGHETERSLRVSKNEKKGVPDPPRRRVGGLLAGLRESYERSPGMQSAKSLSQKNGAVLPSVSTTR